MSGRPRWQQESHFLWQALNSILGLMQEAAMQAVLQQFPSLVEAITTFACCGLGVSWPAVGCLKSILLSAKAKVSSCCVVPGPCSR